ncbi:MAG: hypothetical protein N2749_06730 [Clostridia bacterium]|nr:hypothetical protein [Clostridia bacterium]
MIENILILMIGYILGICSFNIFIKFKQNLNKTKDNEFDRKYNLGKEFCDNKKDK